MIFDAVIRPDYQLKCWARLFAFPAILSFIGASPCLAEDKLFPPDAVINVTLPPYNAKPEKGFDNTAILQRAITDNVGTRRILYFPAGTYEISNTLVAKNKAGSWAPYLTLQGQGQDKTILKLADKSNNFNDIFIPRPMLSTGSLQEKGDSISGGGNKAFSNNIFDLTFDTGSGNFGAVGIEYAVSNQGSIENVTIRNGDGRGVAGISMLREIPGPGLLKNVTITGFDVGVDIADIQYGITMEDITLKGQRVLGIRDDQNLLYIRHLKSDNTVEAIEVAKPKGEVVLLDSSMINGATYLHAIDSNGSLFLRNNQLTGYGASPVRCNGFDLTGFGPNLYMHPGLLGTPPTANKMEPALLPVEETPDYPWDSNLSDWAPVGTRQAGEQDDTAAIQRAIDSGKGTIYFPNNRTYFLSDTVIIRGEVRRVLGLGSEISLGAAKVPFSDVAHPRPLIRIDPTSGKTVFLEGIFFNAQYPGEVLFENNTPSTVVIKHCMGWVGANGHRHSYRNTPQATGSVFLEDVFLPGWEFSHQTVWARQLNPENPDGDGVEPQVSNIGGKLWILGFKTEGPAPFISTTDGGTTELLGAYNYISATHAPQIPADAVPYIITNSTAALTFLTDNFRDNDYRVYIRETQGTQIHNWKGSDLAPRDSSPHDRSFVVPLWRSQKWE